MTSEEVKKEFVKLMTLADNRTISNNEICDALYQLADRQYHTYSYLDQETKNRISNWIEQNWVSDIHFIGNLGMIGGALGIRRICDLLRLNNNSDLPSDIQKRIEEILMEIEPNIDDPYRDLK